MKAAIFHGPRDIRIEEIERPKAGDDGIVVRVKAAGICGSDLHPYVGSGLPREKIARGHENAGEVVEVGANVKDLKIGDRVWVEAVLHCFECDWCKQGGYRTNYFRCRNVKAGGIGGLHGGFAEYLWVPLVVLPEEGTDNLPSVIKLPDSMSFQDGALIEPMTVGAGAVKYAQPTTDDIAVVLGAGIIGLGTVLQLKAHNVARVIATDISAKRLQAARELGADLTLNPSDDDLVKRIMQETSGRGADIVVETAGKPDTLRQSISLVRRAGKIMLVGLYEESVEINANLLVLKAIRTIGCIDAHFLESFEIMQAGMLKDKQVVTHTFPLDKITEAFETAIDTQESIKVMIEP